MKRRSLLKLLGVFGIAPVVSKADEDVSCSQGDLEFDSKVIAVTDLSLLPRNPVDYQVVNVWGYGDFIYLERHGLWEQL